MRNILTAFPELDKISFKRTPFKMQHHRLIFVLYFYFFLNIKPGLWKIQVKFVYANPLTYLLQAILYLKKYIKIYESWEKSKRSSNNISVDLY